MENGGGGVGRWELFGALKMQRNLSLSGGGERTVTTRRAA